MGSTAPAAEVETGRIRPGAAHRPRAVALVLEGVALVEEAGGTSPRCYASSAESMATLPTSVPTPIGRATAEAWTSAETAEGEGEGQRHIEGSPGHCLRRDHSMYAPRYRRNSPDVLCKCTSKAYHHRHCRSALPRDRWRTFRQSHSCELSKDLRTLLSPRRSGC